MAEKTTIARPYAKAVFALAQDNAALAHWGDALDALAALAQVSAVAALIEAPEVDADRRADILIEIAGKSIDEKGQNLLRLLSEKHRLDCLPEIAAEYAQLRSEAEAVMDVEMRSAVEVDEGRRATIIANLKNRFGRDVRLHCVVDDSVVGGLVLKAGDTVIDDSIRGKLDKLAAAMTL